MPFSEKPNKFSGEGGRGDREDADELDDRGRPRGSGRVGSGGMLRNRTSSGGMPTSPARHGVPLHRTISGGMPTSGARVEDKAPKGAHVSPVSKRPVYLKRASDSAS